MASFVYEYTFQITDVNGDSAQMRIKSFAPDTTTIASLVTNSSTLNGLIAPLTNGKVTARGVTLTVDKAQISSATAPPPADAVYPSVTDGARMNFSNNIGARRVVVVPAPVESVFKTDTNTVNPDQSDVAAFIAEIIALGEDPAATNLYEGGVKIGRHARKRATRKSL